MTAELTPQCQQSRRDDSGHDWNFDGDDPYVICGWCDEMQDAISGRVIRKGRPSQETAEREAEVRHEIDRLKEELGLADAPETLAAALAAAERMRPESASKSSVPELTGPALTVARILTGGAWDAGVRNCDIGSHSDVASLAEEIVTALGLASCDRCGGTGTVHVTVYGGHDVDCGMCRGSGAALRGGMTINIRPDSVEEPDEH